jgi:hypothetical protein
VQNGKNKPSLILTAMHGYCKKYSFSPPLSREARLALMHHLALLYRPCPSCPAVVHGFFGLRGSVQCFSLHDIGEFVASIIISK